MNSDLSYNLTGKTALITGASSGLGERFAKVLGAAGCRVIIAARRLDKLKALSAELDNALPIQMDVIDKESVRDSFEALEEAGEKIDICINNAGIAALTPIFDEEGSDDDFASIIQTNLMGVWYVTRRAAGHMKKQAIHGSIINISSINGANKVREGIAAYASSKAAVIQLTKALVGELAAQHIRINCICPGLFHTPLTDHKLSSDSQKEGMKKAIPLGFVAKPEDLDAALLLLASNAHSSYMTGSCLTIDGGASWGG